jgi:hypothetical protein
MIDWTSSLDRALDARATPVDVFFRDDDAGWADDRLFRLLDLFAAHASPIDLAAIPAAVNDRLASDLLERKSTGAMLGVHQHGFTHRNHEAAGRACEFGPSRSATAQSDDIGQGQRVLRELFGEHLDPIFTPPWNRCTEDTGNALVEHGLAAISRDLTAGRLGIAGLAECPVHVDWFAKARRERLPRLAWSVLAADRLAAATAPVGIMLHHAEMDDDEFEACAALLRTVAGHPNVRLQPMKTALEMS